MAEPILTPAAKDDGPKLLDRIEASIARGLNEAGGPGEGTRSGRHRSIGLTTATAPTTDSRAPAHLDAAGRLAEAVEALLAADEEEARAWTGLAERATARLRVIAGSAAYDRPSQSPGLGARVRSMAKFAVLLPAAGRSVAIQGQGKEAVRHARRPGRLAADSRAFRQPAGRDPVPPRHRTGRSRKVPHCGTPPTSRS